MTAPHKAVAYPSVRHLIVYCSVMTRDYKRVE